MKSIGPVDRHELGDVVLDELELGLPDVLDVLERPRVEVVDADDPVAELQQVLAKMRAQEAGAPRHNANRHLETAPQSLDSRKFPCRMPL